MSIKKRLPQIVCLIILVFATTGCEQYKRYFRIKKLKKQNLEKTFNHVLPQKVESVDLAEIILKPAPPNLAIKKDPFKPLLQQSFSPKQERIDLDQEALKEAKILGITKIGSAYSVLMSLGRIKGVFSLNDDIGGFTLKDIKSDAVILKKGEKSYTIKRGENE